VPVSKRNTPQIEKILFSLTEAGAMLSLSRSALYVFIANGKLKTVKKGRRRLVLRDELERFAKFDA